jgi:hypothetical protein
MDSKPANQLNQVGATPEELEQLEANLLADDSAMAAAPILRRAIAPARISSLLAVSGVCVVCSLINLSGVSMPGIFHFPSAWNSPWKKCGNSCFESRAKTIESFFSK